MTVQCIRNIGNFPALVLPFDCSQEISENNFVSSSEWYTIDSNCSGYCISLDKKYKVYGILIYDNMSRFLIQDDNNIPNFYPSQLFSLTDPSLFDPYWEYNCILIEKKECIVIGYSDLVRDYCHLRDLIDNKPDAIKQFLHHKEKLNSIGW